MKECSKCGKPLPISEYHRASSRIDGLRPDCKTCRRIYMKSYTSENKIKIASQRKIRRACRTQAQKEKERARIRKYRSTPEYKKQRQQYEKSYKPRKTSWAMVSRDTPIGRLQHNVCSAIRIHLKKNGGLELPG